MILNLFVKIMYLYMIVKNGKKTTSFTTYFLISEEKANSLHRFAIYRSCKRAYPDKQESELKFVNKKMMEKFLVLHLKVSFFIIKYYKKKTKYI